MIVHGFGDHEVEEAERLLRAVEKVQLVALDRRIERRAKFLPVREQLVERTRLEHRAGQDVRTNFRALLDDADADFLAGFSGDLLQAASGGQSGRAGSDRKSTRLNSSH